MLRPPPGLPLEGEESTPSGASGFMEGEKQEKYL